ncbi:hypothetical protein GPECTOR_253g634 [Gonium pectorale]|uniref:Uncharacterized protein n=1 Tax=Gonium pectorale TaxID=33097 RepID=A0A150FXX8_GONPE|nr:hypothetical protein GPECTOR_253g634 [Gonium pectorale]|eukprot:KXZ41880.1 hypothetical protein GPECTOR_253g634 [Gonium pectorale]
MACLEEALDGADGSEVWKTQLLMLATKVAYVSSAQAGRLLAWLRYRSERADAAAMLLSACPDLHRAPWALATHARFGPDDMAELLQELSLAPLLPLRNRVVNGWDSCCSGHIRLDLSRQSHRLLAVMLVQIYLSSANIPTAGILDMHFVNVRPRTHVEYVGRGLGRERRQAPTYLLGKSPPDTARGSASTTSPGAGLNTMVPAGSGRVAGGSGMNASAGSGGASGAGGGGLYGTGSGAGTGFRRATFGSGTAAALPPPAVGASVVALESMRMAATFLSQSLALNAVVGKKNWWQPYHTAWEGLYLECLLRLGLPHNHPYLAGWRNAVAMWKGQYRAFSAKLHDAIRARHASYLPGTQRNSGEGESEGADGGRRGAGKKGVVRKDAKRGGKRGGGNTDGDDGLPDTPTSPTGKKPSAAAAVASAATVTTSASAGGRKAAGGAAKRGGKRGEPESAPGGGAVDGPTGRLLSVTEMRARQLAPAMIDLACGVSLSCFTVLHLLRLLPDLELRVKVLVAVWPAIWDRGNVVDLILDLDHPVALPPPPPPMHGSGVSKKSPAALARASVAAAAAGMQHGGVEGLLPLTESVTHKGLTERSGTSTGGLSAPHSPGPTTARGPGPHTAGYLPAGAGALAGRTLHLHLGAIDQLQAMASICRFADRCYRSTGLQVVTGLACDGVAQYVEEAANLPGGVWELILRRTVLCLDRPEYGTVSIQLGGITADAQRAVAALTIQAVWRGHRVRQQQYAEAVVAAGSSRWRRVVGCMRLLRRLAVMRTLAADLDISRAQGEMERGYLRMLYGPNAA